jgi:hypothetical protein
MGQFSTRAPHAPLSMRGVAGFPAHAGKSILVSGAGGGSERRRRGFRRRAARAWPSRPVDQPPEAVLDPLVSSRLHGRIEPEEVARAISLLLNDDAFLIRGRAVNADGGDTPY